MTWLVIKYKIANQITKVSETSKENNSQTVANKHNKKIPKEKYLSLEERKRVIDELRLK